MRQVTGEMRELILATVGDAAIEVAYAGRKEDEELPRGAIEQAIAEGVITVDEMVAHFAEELRKWLR